MIPIDTSKKNINKILEILSKDNKFKGGMCRYLSAVIFNELLKANKVEITKKIGAVNCLFKKKNKIFGTNGTERLV